MSAYIVEVQDLYFRYPDQTEALRGISLKIEAGKKIGILGPNGAGKSTLFLHLNGILRPSKGKVVYKGKEVKYNHRGLLELRKQVGIVFQDPDIQLFSASVYQEVSYGVMNQKLPQEIVKERVEKALQEMDIGDLKEKPIHFLSYGQKKRVSIADILAMEPEVIILDEPTAFLDPVHGDQIMELLDQMNGRGTTLILSTHDVDRIYGWADYIFVMKEGQLIKEGTPEEVFQDQNALAAAALKRPLILDIYEALVENKVIGNGRAPRSKEELIERIGECG